MRLFIKQFLYIAEIYPDNLAINVDNSDYMSYSKLLQETLVLAERLKQKEIGVGCLVALHLDKSPSYIISLLAVWMTGAAFVPLAPALPEMRKNFILNECTPNLIIHSDDQLEICHTKPLYHPDLAYIFFTSGSTGTPKGVMVPHDGLINILEQQIQEFQINHYHRFLFYLSTQFDASLSDIGTTLLAGACLCLVSGDQLDIANHLPQILQENQITHIDIPPSLLAIINRDAMPNCIRTIIIGGEVCPVEVVRLWASKFRLINVYGPTETTICTSMQLCASDWNVPSIGKAIEQMSYLVLDEVGNEACIGELFIAGIGLALGYLNNTTLTAKKFVYLNNTRYYRTGDRVMKMPDGTYVYLSRIDRQVKIRGQLVAPEEIEAVLNQHHLVRCSAVFCTQSKEKKQLCAVVEAQGITVPILYYFLQARLPSWMIPKQIIVSDQLPKNSHGKIDYIQLKQLSFKQKPINTHLQLKQIIARDLQSQNQISKSDTEYQLQQLWQEALELPSPPSIHDDLFATLGADSMDVLKIIVRAEAYGYHFSIELMHHLRTIHSLSLWIQLDKEPSTDAKSTNALKKEIDIFEQPHTVSINSNDRIFITGTTGFLGIYILEQLLINTTAKITCLIRADNHGIALEKIRQAAKRHNRLIETNLHRIIIVLGDLSLPQLGLSDKIWLNLCQQISTIYHVGAEVNMFKSYESLKATNVTATKEIARLASSIKKKQLCYISTLSVFVATDHHTGICYEEDKLEKTQFVYGGYAQSKWAAEYFLQHSGLEVTIFRLGLITGNSVNGTSYEHDYLQLFVQGLMDIGRIPEGPWDEIFLDATPVDFAAKAIVHLAKHPIAHCYHLANSSAFSLQMIVDGLKKLGRSLLITSTSEWHSLSLLNAKMAATSMALCRLFKNSRSFQRYRSMDLFQATGVVFHQKNTLAGLEGSDIVCPLADAHLLDLYLRRIIYG